MKRVFLFACAMIIVACCNVAQAKKTKPWTVSAMADIETMSHLRDFSVSSVAIRPNIEGSFQYKEIRTSLGVVLPCGKSDPVKIEWGGYAATDCTRDWLIYGGITVGARNHAFDSQKVDYLITRGIFEGHTIYLPDYIGGIRDWAAEVGIRFGYQHEFVDNWAIHLMIGAKYSPYCNNRWIKTPEWALDEPKAVQDDVHRILTESIDIEPVNDFGIYAKLGLSYCF